MKVYAGIDLHSSNNYLGILDEEGRKVYGKSLPNRLPSILRVLQVYREDVVGVVVESTYNWYWLVDGLKAQGYRVHLANPSAIKQYEGLKHTDDRWDAFWLAQMLRLNILPEGYIYPAESRPLRDLLRRRLFLVHHRTSLILSFQSLVTRDLGSRISVNAVKKLSCAEAADLFSQEHHQSAAAYLIYLIKCFTTVIVQIEREVLAQARLRPEYEYLLTIPGIGKILGLTIMMEVGEIGRFAKVGHYSSYCRCVGTKRLSNGKSKGRGNRKNGNKYLAWAYIEAAHYAGRYCAQARTFLQRKRSKTNKIVAIKALSHKLARASYWVMKRQEPFQVQRLFG